MQQQLFEWPSRESFCSNQKREKPIHPYWHLCNLSTHLKKGGTFKGNWSTLYSFKGTEIGDNWTYFAPIWSFSFVKAELQMYLLVTTWGPLPHSWCLDIIPHLWNWFKQSNFFDYWEKSNNFGFPFYISYNTSQSSTWIIERENEGIVWNHMNKLCSMKMQILEIKV